MAPNRPGDSAATPFDLMRYAVEEAARRERCYCGEPSGHTGWLVCVSAEVERAKQEACEPAVMWPVKWVHCSPTFVAENNCGNTPRRACQCPDGGSHDHAITDWEALPDA